MASPGPYRKLFPPELRTASIVPRWSIVQTLRPDVVSNHSFFVTFYARQIAKLINWRGSYEDLMYYGLVHDLDELITGDVVSPIKVAIVDHDKSNRYVSTKMSVSMPDIEAETSRIVRGNNKNWEHLEIKHIVKAADRLDALLFLITEQRLGNTIVEPRIEECYKLFKEAWWKLPGLIEQQKTTTWATMEQEISWHKDMGGTGV